MNKTRKKEDFATDSSLLIDTASLQIMLGCGRESAVKIGIDAEARLKVGRRVLWNVEKIKAYIEKACS